MLKLYYVLLVYIIFEGGDNMKEKKIELFKELLELTNEQDDLLEEIKEMKENCKIAINE